jgi:regulator of PEP synthase PpsR (kinase-PPPase family)
MAAMKGHSAPAPGASPVPADRTYYLFVVSDATGETAVRMAGAAISQFEKREVVLVRRPNVRTEDHLRDVVREAGAVHGTILHTLVSGSNRKRLLELTRAQGIPAIDLMGPLLAHLETFFGSTPKAEPGLLHRMDEDYLRRIEAVQFTVNHDDGQNVQTLHQSDIVLVGASRTGKTPLSMYMAQYGWKVANVPIILGLPPPKELFTIDPDKVVALMISPDKLRTIRAARVEKFRQQDLRYAQADAIAEELDYCRVLFAAHPSWRVLDVTSRAIEEVAADIMSVRSRPGRPAP